MKKTRANNVLFYNVQDSLLLHSKKRSSWLHDSNISDEKIHTNIYLDHMFTFQQKKI